MLDRIRHDKLKSAIEDLGMHPGIALVGDLVNAVAEVNTPEVVLRNARKNPQRVREGRRLGVLRRSADS